MTPLEIQQETELMNRVLLGTFLTLKSSHFVQSQSLRTLLRTGKWGTCSACPGDESGVYPERCENSKRPDHAIYSTWGGKFYQNEREVTREKLLAALK